jgi:tRNA(fMet)-specific endonuclease VapC
VNEYLLDTNILSDLIRNPQGSVARHIARVGEKAVCTSVVVAAELRYGARKRGSQRLSAQVEAILAIVPILPLEHPVDEAYADIRVALEGAGTPIGANDLLVAAQAVSLGCVMVTANSREFSYMPNLRTESWI